MQVYVAYHGTEVPETDIWETEVLGVFLRKESADEAVKTHKSMIEELDAAEWIEDTVGESFEERYPDHKYDVQTVKCDEQLPTYISEMHKRMKAVTK